MDLTKYRLKLNADLFRLRAVVRKVVPDYHEGIAGNYDDERILYSEDKSRYHRFLRHIQDLRLNGGDFLIAEGVNLEFRKNAVFNSIDGISFPLGNYNGETITIAEEADALLSSSKMVKAIKPYIELLEST